MERHPQPEREYEAETKFCRLCGEPSKASPNKSANEPAGKREAASGPPASHVTSHMDGFFPANPQPVERIPETKDDARAKEGPSRQEAAKDSEPAQDASPRAEGKPAPPPTPDPLAAAAVAHYRSARALSRAVIIGHVVTTLGLIAFALIFAFSQQQQLKTSEARVLALIERDRSATAALTQATDKLFESAVKVAVLEEKTENLEQRDAAREVALKEMTERYVERRIQSLPANLTSGERGAMVRNLRSILPTIKDADAKLAAREVERSLRHGEDRASVHKKYRRLLSKLDEQAEARPRAEVVDKVGRMLGE